MSDPKDILVTCPSCGHTHTIEVDSADLHPNPERTYKLKDVEKILGLSRRTLKQLIYDGKLKAEKSGDSQTSGWYVSESAIAEYRRSRGDRRDRGDR